jgi:hypothetical protein
MSPGTTCTSDPDFLPGGNEIDGEIDVWQLHGAVRQHHFKAIGIAGLSEQAFGLPDVGLMVLAEAWQLL